MKTIYRYLLPQSVATHKCTTKCLVLLVQFSVEFRVSLNMNQCEFEKIASSMKYEYHIIIW